MTGSTTAKRIVPAWSYKPGPDVSDVPPPGLARAQALARQACAVGLSALEPGRSEEEIDLVVSDFLAQNGVEHVWTITNVGLGENTKICFPTKGPGPLKAAERDVLMLDVHPITPDGHWGDCTRCRVLGDWPEASLALADLERIHAKTLAFCRPGMPAGAGSGGPSHGVAGAAGGAVAHTGRGGGRAGGAGTASAAARSRHRGADRPSQPRAAGMGEPSVMAANPRGA
ncbi:M24 family metallopeptidase [Roseococcus sp.]|uniref:M24 family metallopeptidase n=1 Tax=Roseococcus sp. TaxID=2109646 RepID=UPI003BAD2C36